MAKEEPLLKQDGLQGAPLYYDCSTDDARLTLETIIDATRNGAVVVSWARVDALLKHIPKLKIRNNKVVVRPDTGATSVSARDRRSMEVLYQTSSRTRGTVPYARSRHTR